MQVALAVAALMGHHDVVHQRRVDAAQRRDLVDVGDAAAELHQHLARNVFARFVAQGLLDEVGTTLRDCDGRADRQGQRDQVLRKA
jgi:hypothetical protein